MFKSFPAGNRTRVTRVTGGYTNLYTTEKHAEDKLVLLCGHSLVVRTPRCGRGNPGSILGDRSFCAYALNGDTKRGPWRARTADLLLTEETL